jgi:hypothetical protein
MLVQGVLVIKALPAHVAALKKLFVMYEILKLRFIKAPFTIST